MVDWAGFWVLAVVVGRGPGSSVGRGFLRQENRKRKNCLLSAMDGLK